MTSTADMLVKAPSSPADATNAPAGIRGHEDPREALRGAERPLPQSRAQEVGV